MYKKKNYFFVVLSLMLCGMTDPSNAQATTNPWAEAEQIVQSIRKTSFPDRTFSIVDFGAIEGDSVRLCHEEINRVIVVCSQAGGGTVCVPKGAFYTGPITLKSNVNLHIEEGATLYFSKEQKHYFPGVLTRWEGIDCYNARPLIYAYGETNIAITGKGTIDGRADHTNWWGMTKRFPGAQSQQYIGRTRLLFLAETFMPVYQRVMTMEDGLRPQLINFHSCSQLLIEGVTLKNSPFWMIHPLLCQDMIVRDVYIESHGPNSDGCDPESSKNVLIENCYFNTGDDCIAIKSGRNADGRKWNIPSENIIVRLCQMKNGHGGVVIGSEISGGYKNLYVEDCEMDSPELDRVIRIKTSTCRGGTVENVYVRNVKVGQCKEAVLRINLKYEPLEICERSFTPLVRNVHLENVTCEKSKYGVLLIGLDDETNISNVTLTNCTFNNVEEPISITGAEDEIGRAHV